jgi:flagellar basal-body rod modification protein FlgD
VTVSSTEGISPAWIGANATGATGSKDHDMFLQLLVAQLKYQDPMNPTDSSQFMSQNAQFTSLEKMQNVADSMTQLLNAQMTFGAAGMIGKQVTYADVSGGTHTGTATGANFSASGPSLTIDGATVPVSMIVSVNAADAS